MRVWAVFAATCVLSLHACYAQRGNTCPSTFSSSGLYPSASRDVYAAGIAVAFTAGTQESSAIFRNG